MAEVYSVPLWCGYFTPGAIALDHFTELTLESYQTFLIQHSLVVIDFWAPSCAPCLAMLPLLQQLGQKFPELTLTKINADAEPVLVREFNVRSLPTLVVINQRLEVGRITGVCGESQILELLNPWLKKDSGFLLYWQQQRDKGLTAADIAALETLQSQLEQQPDNARMRALLMHCWLDLIQNRHIKQCAGADKLQHLLVADDFDWLRDPVVQQAKQRADWLLEEKPLPGLTATDADQVYRCIKAGDFYAAASCLMNHLEHAHNNNDEKIISAFLQLIDVIPDRRMAQQLRRRFFQWQNSK